MRVQVALNVSDLEQAIDYYSRLLGAPVAKRRPGYANFAIDEPPLKLVLFENPGAAERLNHLGVEVFEGAEVLRAAERLEAEGLPHEVIKDERCCWAEKNTVYSKDPQGLLWEYYEVTGNLEAPSEAASAPSPAASPACVPSSDGAALAACDATPAAKASCC
jgi:catechol 2,3-dioxygenase-like lactoylglutathione lyase family enzyme